MSGYPPNPGAGYPPQPGYGGAPGGYPPAGAPQAGYPPAGYGAAPPAQGGYPPAAQPGYGAPPGGGYGAPPGGGYGAPPGGGYGAPPTHAGYPPQPGYGAPPAQAGYPPAGHAPQPGYGAAPHASYPPQPGAGYPPQQHGYPPQQPAQQPAYGAAPGAYPPQHDPRAQQGGYGHQQQHQQHGVPPAGYAAAGAAAGVAYGAAGGKPAKPKTKPTLKPHTPFNPDDDARALRKAMKGLGTDEKGLINVLCYRTLTQRLEIEKRYKAVIGRDLVKDLKSETSGDFKDILANMFLPKADYSAYIIHKAIDGVGTKEQWIIEILISSTNKEIKDIQASYKRLYGKNIEKDIKGDTSGHFEKFLVILSQGNRDENPRVDMQQVKQDAQALYTAGEGKWGTDEHTFNQIMLKRSIPHLKNVFLEYDKIGKKKILDVMESEFSGSVRTGFKALVRYIQNPFVFYATALYKSMEGAGTDDTNLIRLVLTRCEIDLGDIKEVYQKVYRKQLAEHIRGDTSGDYKNTLLALIR